MMAECGQVVPVGCSFASLWVQDRKNAIRSVFMPQNGQQPTKKPYTTPTLTAYGDVRKITEAVNHTGKFDSFPLRSGG